MNPLSRTLAVLLLVGAGDTGMAQAPAVPDIFRGADLALGSRLIKEHRCSECHARHVGGDGSDLYNPKGRISSPGALRGMVEQCNTEMNLGLFPEEVTAVAAVLQRDHYRFRP
jgi:hypothetical protein